MSLSRTANQAIDPQRLAQSLDASALQGVRMPAVPASSAHLSRGAPGLISVQTSMGMVGGMSPMERERLRTSALTSDLSAAIRGPSLPQSSLSQTRHPSAAPGMAATPLGSQIAPQLSPSAMSRGVAAAPGQMPAQAQRLAQPGLGQASMAQAQPMMGAAPSQVGMRPGLQPQNLSSPNAHGAMPSHAAHSERSFGQSSALGSPAGTGSGGSFHAQAEATGGGGGHTLWQMKGQSPFKILLGKTIGVLCSLIGISPPRR